MIEFRKIDRSNYIECIDLTLTDVQKQYIASNEFSLVQAAYEPEVYTLAIYNENKMIGFILYHFEEELNGFGMSRFMIDSAFQNRGLGRQALTQFLEYFKKKHPEIRELYTSAMVDNTVALKLCSEAGFKELNVFEYEHRGCKHREVRMLLTLIDCHRNCR